MKVVIASGIWPPDVGGPASHAPALAAALHAHGHEVTVVTTADRSPARERYRVRFASRSLPPGLRHLRAALLVAGAARGADVVYATSMIRRAAIGAALARTPLVVKLVADEPYERARRSGRFSGTLEEFQQRPGSITTRLAQVTRTAAVRRARRVFVPSGYLREIAVAWGLDSARVETLHNPAPPVDGVPSREEARAALSLDGFVVAFAGRLTEQKWLGGALGALAQVPGPVLVLVGDGPERQRLERRAAELGISSRVRFLGGGERADVLRLFRAADCSLLSSAWENFPHTVVESLAVGTPVIATAVGGVPEVVRDGENGLLVPPRDELVLAAALRRVVEDGSLLRRLAAGAAPSVAALEEKTVLAHIERALAEVAG